MTLDSLKPGQSAVIHTVGGEGALRQHFLVWRHSRRADYARQVRPDGRPHRIPHPQL